MIGYNRFGLKCSSQLTNPKRPLRRKNPSVSKKAVYKFWRGRYLYRLGQVQIPCATKKLSADQNRDPFVHNSLTPSQLTLLGVGGLRSTPRCEKIIPREMSFLRLGSVAAYNKRPSARHLPSFFLKFFEPKFSTNNHRQV